MATPGKNFRYLFFIFQHRFHKLVFVSHSILRTPILRGETHSWSAFVFCIIIRPPVKYNTPFFKKWLYFITSYNIKSWQLVKDHHFVTMNNLWILLVRFEPLLFWWNRYWIFCRGGDIRSQSNFKINYIFFQIVKWSPILNLD